jgi:hypothetical protein
MGLTLRKNQLIICDGDSMTNRRSVGSPDTWPFLRLMNWDKPWPDYVAEILFCWRPELDLKFFNAASGGATCRTLAEKFEGSVLRRKPDWVICSVAGNDLRLRVPLAEYRERMTSYAGQLTGAGCRVLFYGLSEHGPDYPKGGTMKGRRALYAVLKSIAGSLKGVHYVDLGSSVAAKAHALKKQHELHTIYGDAGHFNAVGNLILAGEILRVFGVVR